MVEVIIILQILAAMWTRKIDEDGSLKDCLLEDHIFSSTSPRRGDKVGEKRKAFLVISPP